MTTKTVLTLIGAILGLQSIGIYFGAEAITKEAFASLNPDATGIAIGTMLHQVLAVVNLMVASILLFARDLEPPAGAKVLTGMSVGLLLTVAQGVYHMLATEVAPPIPLLVIMSVLMVLGFVTAAKAKVASA